MCCALQGRLTLAPPTPPPSRSAIKYREINKVDTRVVRGTAVNIQAMVYGNINDRSCTGVCFTRNPANGTKELFGEYLPNAQVGHWPAGAQH